MLKRVDIGRRKRGGLSSYGYIRIVGSLRLSPSHAIKRLTIKIGLLRADVQNHVKGRSSRHRFSLLIYVSVVLPEGLNGLPHRQAQLRGRSWCRHVPGDVRGTGARASAARHRLSGR